MASDDTQLTLLLKQCAAGDKKAESRLYTAVYSELRKLAARHMRREAPDHTLRPTALVNEAYLRLLGGQTSEYKDRGHFLYLASQVMRHILVDHARKRLTSKRGAGVQFVPLDERFGVTGSDMLELIHVHEALDRLAAKDPTKARIVQLRYFGGLSVEETAAVIGRSEKTVKRQWTLAREWLYQEISGREA